MTARAERMLSIAEVADRLGLSRMAVYRMVHAGELPADRAGVTFHVPESALQQKPAQDHLAETA